MHWRSGEGSVANRIVMIVREIPTDTLNALKAVVGPGGWIEEETEKAPFLVDERELFCGNAPLVVRPTSTQQVAAIVRICSENKIGVVPQGGKTGYVGGSVPRQNGPDIVVLLSGMRRIREIDAVNRTMTVEAGCILADVQRVATDAGRLFPLSLAAEGSCQIGGNLSTNAGGTQVLRYGNTRDLVLGLEVVLANGEIWDGLRKLRKDNTGYDLKQLFLGAEGTLGIITAAVVKLFPLPTARCTAFVSLPDADAALGLLTALRTATADSVTSFEYVHRACLDLVLDHLPGTSDPLGTKYEHYVLVEIDSARSEDLLRPQIEDSLANALERGEILDAVIATSHAQAERLWHLRESIPEAQKRAGGCIKHDVSVPVSRVPEFLTKALNAAVALIPEARVAPFGHLGDGNIHFNLSQPPGSPVEEFLSQTERVSTVIHDIAVELEGSFSAEHGIGRLKKRELHRYKSPLELRLMHAIKNALDPLHIMNPEKVL